MPRLMRIMRLSQTKTLFQTHMKKTIWKSAIDAGCVSLRSILRLFSCQADTCAH